MIRKDEIIRELTTIIKQLDVLNLLRLLDCARALKSKI